MKGLILLITGPFAMMFAIASFQTIEWNIDNNEPVPTLAYILLVIVAIWCVFAATINEKEIKEFDEITNDKKDDRDEEEN